MTRDPECPLLANRGLQGTELTDRRLLGIPMHDDGRHGKYIGTHKRTRYRDEPRVLQHARLSRRVLDAIGEGRADVALLWLARANAVDGAERERWIARLDALVKDSQRDARVRQMVDNITTDEILADVEVIRQWANLRKSTNGLRALTTHDLS